MYISPALFLLIKSLINNALQDFINRWYFREYYDQALEALEELQVLLPALEPYSSDSNVADTIKAAKQKILQAEQQIPNAKIRFESQPLLEKTRATHQRLDVSYHKKLPIKLLFSLICYYTFRISSVLGITKSITMRPLKRSRN